MAIRSRESEGSASSVQTGVLFGQAAAMLCVTAAGVWVAILWTANALGFSHGLGLFDCPSQMR